MQKKFAEAERHRLDLNTYLGRLHGKDHPEYAASMADTSLIFLMQVRKTKCNRVV
jgi:hypothetical protein